MWTVSTQLAGAPRHVETYSDHAKAREAYDRAIASRVYMQVHIEGPGYGVEAARRAIGKRKARR